MEDVEVDTDPEEGIVEHVTRWITEARPTGLSYNLVIDPVWPRFPIQTLQLVHHVIRKRNTAPEVQARRFWH